MRNKAPKNFEGITIEEAVSVLNRCVQSKVSVLCWTKDQAQNLKAPIETVFETSGIVFFSFFKNTEAEAFQRRLGQLAISEIFVSVTLPTDVVFFKAELRRVDDRFIHFRLINPMFKVQRRAGLRLPVPEHNKMQAHFEYPSGSGLKVEAPLLDISSGGIALLFTDQPCRDEFKTGSLLGELNFMIRERKISVICEVRYTREISFSKLKKGIKVGIQFLQISESDRDFIAEYVLEESSKYFGRIGT